MPENPLLRKNIPAPPIPTSSPSSSRTVSEDKGETVERQNGKTVVVPSEEVREQEEKATIELSLYLRPSQDDKLEDLRRAYKRRTGKKISANEVMRRLIERALLDDLL